MDDVLVEEYYVTTRVTGGTPRIVRGPYPDQGEALQAASGLRHLRTDDTVQYGVVGRTTVAHAISEMF